MRKSCVDCILKHVGSAIILAEEAVLGYPHHFVYAVGHLAQAEEEALKDYPEIAEMIRNLRIDYMTFGTLDGENLAKIIYEFREKHKEDSPSS